MEINRGGTRGRGRGQWMGVEEEEEERVAGDSGLGKKKH